MSKVVRELIWDSLHDYPSAPGWYVVERAYDDGPGYVSIIRDVEYFDGEKWAGDRSLPYVFLPTPVDENTDADDWEISFS